MIVQCITEDIFSNLESFYKIILFFFYEMFMHYYMNARIYKVVKYTNINAYPVGECNSCLIEDMYITR